MGSKNYNKKASRIITKALALIMCSALILGVSGGDLNYVLAAEDQGGQTQAGVSLYSDDNLEYTASKDTHSRKENAIELPDDNMTNPSFWMDKTKVDSNTVLMTTDEIKALNQAIVNGEGTNVRDLENDIADTFNADSIRSSLAGADIPTSDLYVNGQKLDNVEYFNKIQNAIADTGYTGTSIPTKYAIATNRADMKGYPTDDWIGYSATDTDDEYQIAILNVNDPFVIRAKCIIDGQTFYYGYSQSCSGWVNGKNLALVDTKEEWVNIWKTEVTDTNILVVIGSQINLEKDNCETVKLKLGTVLKLVPDSQIPAELVSQKENNYIVYFPGRDGFGNYVQKIAVINKNLEVNKGYLTLTQANLLKVAFSCFGDSYGWGGMDGNMDCSLYTQCIYKCFGFMLPRNTTWQMNTPDKAINIEGLSDEEKYELFSNLTAGALLYFSGHTMMYIGQYNGIPYIISDLGAVYLEDGTTFVDAEAVTVNSLLVRRGNGKTWLTNMSGVLDLTNIIRQAVEEPEEEPENQPENQPGNQAGNGAQQATGEAVGLDSDKLNNSLAEIDKAIAKAENSGSQTEPLSIDIDMKNGDGSIATLVPTELLSAIKGENVSLVLNMGDYSWTINGNDITDLIEGGINLEVKLVNDVIPEELVSQKAGDNPTKQLSLTYDGPFGFVANLKLNLGSEYSGKYGNLYYFDQDGNLVFISSGLIDSAGNASLRFLHASDYLVVIGEKVGTNDIPNTGDMAGEMIPYLTICMLMAGMAMTITGLGRRRSKFE